MTDRVGRRAFLAASAAVAAAPLALAAAAVPAGTVPAGDVVMIVRHGEKPHGHGKPYGVRADGERDHESLTTTGWARAGALVELFDPRTQAGPGDLRSGLARPDRLYAADPAHGSRRPAETLTPLAARLRIDLDTRWRKGRKAAIGAHLTASSGVALVAWEHERIPAIARALGTVAPTVPAHWPGDRYDVVWCFTRAAAGDDWTFTQVPELLLAGDRDAPIA